MKHLIACISLMLAAAALNGCITFTGPGAGGDAGLSGALFDGQGAPVAGALVRVYPMGSGVTLAKTAGDSIVAPDSTWTDGEGHFNFPKLKKGRCNLECTFKRNGDTQSVFIPGIKLGDKCDLGKRNLNAPGNILLQAQSEAGAALSGVKCDIPGSPFYATSDNAGKCLIHGIPAGTYRVRLQKDGFLPALSSSLEVQPGKTTDGGVVMLSLIPSAGLHFPIHSSTVALWTFNGRNGGQFIDSTAHHFVLSGNTGYTMQSSPGDSAIAFDGTGGFLQTPNNSAFTVGPTGKITFEARIYMDQYTSTGNFKGTGTVMGMYEGAEMEIFSDGSINIQCQKNNSSAGNYWFKAGQSDAGIISLNRWVDVAIAVDQTVTPGQLYAYVDAHPVQLYGIANPDPQRVSTSVLTVGNDRMDNDPFKGRIDEIRISNNLVLGPGLPLAPLSGADSISHFGLNASTVALWTFNSFHSDFTPDIGPHAFHLESTNGHNGVVAPNLLQPSPFGSSITFDSQVSPLYADNMQVVPPLQLNSPLLTVSGTGKITLEARVYLSQYPSTSNWNKAAMIVGTYEGPHLFIYSDGTLMGGGQKVPATGSSYWYGPYSDSGVVPLNRWVDLAISLDQTSGQAYGYIDGRPIQLYNGPDQTTPDTNPWRISTSAFTVGNSNVDNNPFTGKIDEIRVSNSLILGAGLPVAATTRLLP